LVFWVLVMSIRAMIDLALKFAVVSVKLSQALTITKNSNIIHSIESVRPLGRIVCSLSVSAKLATKRDGRLNRAEPALELVLVSR